MDLSISVEFCLLFSVFFLFLLSPFRSLYFHSISLVLLFLTCWPDRGVFFSVFPLNPWNDHQNFLPFLHFTFSPVGRHYTLPPTCPEASQQVHRFDYFPLPPTCTSVPTSGVRLIDTFPLSSISHISTRNRPPCLSQFVAPGASPLASRPPPRPTLHPTMTRLNRP